jgi:hypothetical protein
MVETMGKANGINQMRTVDHGPEKAGFGGSIPSLATIFNNLQIALPGFGCNWLHFGRGRASPGVVYLKTRTSAPIGAPRLKIRRWQPQRSHRWLQTRHHRSTSTKFSSLSTVPPAGFRSLCFPPRQCGGNYADHLGQCRPAQCRTPLRR